MRTHKAQSQLKSRHAENFPATPTCFYRDNDDDARTDKGVSSKRQPENPQSWRIEYQSLLRGIRAKTRQFVVKSFPRGKKLITSNDP